MVSDSLLVCSAYLLVAWGFCLEGNDVDDAVRDIVNFADDAGRSDEVSV